MLWSDPIDCWNLLGFFWSSSWIWGRLGSFIKGEAGCYVTWWGRLISGVCMPCVCIFISKIKQIYIWNQQWLIILLGLCLILRIPSCTRFLVPLNQLSKVLIWDKNKKTCVQYENELIFNIYHAPSWLHEALSYLLRPHACTLREQYKAYMRRAMHTILLLAPLVFDCYRKFRAKPPLSSVSLAHWTSDR